ncbi:MAG: hypothetical protein FK733_18745 [Asgard group archaeon]|nr:hypothetical protein [Asgard group archaeon]
MADSIARTFGIDFIYFDLILVSIWIVLLIVRRRYKELAIGIFGYGVVHFVDAVIWYTIRKTRDISINPQVMGDHQFLAYFSFTYGMIMFSYAVLMFNRNIHYAEKLLWSALMFGGWLLIGTLSQRITLHSPVDPVFIISRDMSRARLKQGLMVGIGYLVLLIWKVLSEVSDKYPFNLMKSVPWWYFGILVVVGIFVHFSMESTLWIANIRPTNWRSFLINTFLEFNTGIPILFGLWITINQKDYKPAKVVDSEEDASIELDIAANPQTE